MICPRPDCPIEFRAGAIDAYIKREEKAFGHKFNAEMETCAHCEMCEGAPLVCWERLVRFAKDGTRSVEFRRKSASEEEAA